jgi:hypothetical protein
MIARTHQPAIVLGAVKDEPAVAAEGAAILDRPCARRRTRSVAGTEERLRRGRTKNWPEGENIRSAKTVCRT